MILNVTIMKSISEESQQKNYPIYLPFTYVKEGVWTNWFLGWYAQARPFSVLGLLGCHRKSVYLLDCIYKRMCEVIFISSL